jgi:hypothetical protein
MSVALVLCAKELTSPVSGSLGFTPHMPRVMPRLVVEVLGCLMKISLYLEAGNAGVTGMMGEEQAVWSATC